MAKIFVSPETLEETYIAFKLLLLQKPEGCGATEVWREFFQDKLSRSCISNAIQTLNKEGYIKCIGRSGSSLRFTLTDKELKISPMAAHTCLKTAPTKPSPPTFTPDHPEDPNGWITALNKVIDGLSVLQVCIPDLKVGLLDLSKNLERLDKVKDILGDLAKTARRNV